MTFRQNVETLHTLIQKFNTTYLIGKSYYPSWPSISSYGHLHLQIPPNLPSLICPSVHRDFLVTWKVSFRATSLLRWPERSEKTDLQMRNNNIMLKYLRDSVTVYNYFPP